MLCVGVKMQPILADLSQRLHIHVSAHHNISTHISFVHHSRGDVTFTSETLRTKWNGLQSPGTLRCHQSFVCRHVCKSWERYTDRVLPPPLWKQTSCAESQRFPRGGSCSDRALVHADSAPFFFARRCQCPKCTPTPRGIRLSRMKMIVAATLSQQTFMNANSPTTSPHSTRRPSMRRSVPSYPPDRNQRLFFKKLTDFQWYNF